jgi:hypothetical protein
MRETARKTGTEEIKKADAATATGTPTPSTPSSVIHQNLLNRLLKQPAKQKVTTRSQSSSLARQKNGSYATPNPASAVDFYKSVKSRKAGPPANRKRTDVTAFANALFNGGVFNGVMPGTSL